MSYFDIVYVDDPYNEKCTVMLPKVKEFYAMINKKWPLIKTHIHTRENNSVEFIIDFDWCGFGVYDYKYKYYENPRLHINGKLEYTINMDNMEGFKNYMYGDGYPRYAMLKRITEIENRLSKIETKNERLTEENTKLKTHIEYQPDGEAYIELFKSQGGKWKDT